MKFRSSMKKLFLVFILVITFSISFQQIAWAKLSTINVEVYRTNLNGKSWDILKGAPDIAICWANQQIGTLCLPEGDSPTSIHTSQCQDSFKCKFSVDVPDGIFKISVVDVDLKSNDIIGVGQCSKGKTCEIGQSKVSVGNGLGWF